jgi:hypothetical protein
MYVCAQVMISLQMAGTFASWKLMPVVRVFSASLAIQIVSESLIQKL